MAAIGDVQITVVPLVYPLCQHCVQVPDTCLARRVANHSHQVCLAMCLLARLAMGLDKRPLWFERRQSGCSADFVQSAGLRVVMLTGDNIGAATAIKNQVRHTPRNYALW